MTQNIPLAERNEQKEFLQAVGTVMKMCIPGISDMRKILEARVPIIKFCNLHTNMKCDLSSTNTYVINIYYIKIYIYFPSFWGIIIVFEIICTGLHYTCPSCYICMDNWIGALSHLFAPFVSGQEL